MYKCFILLLLIFFSNNIKSQENKLIGKITNTKLEPLAFVTVQIKNNPLHTISKENGNFEISLEKGKYDFVFSLVGYKTQIIPIVIKEKNPFLNIIMEENITNAEDAIVIGHRKDRSEEYIKNVIKNKEKNLSILNSYSANIYIKAVEENAGFIILKKGKNNLKDSANFELQKMSMAEMQIQLDFQQPNKIKETRNAIKKRGNPESLFYLTTTDGDFSLYHNLMKINAIGPTPFLSPISYSGLIAYKYKTIRTRIENKHKIYTITFKPTAMGNALLTGEVEIMDSSWVILSSNFSLPKFHLTEYDNFNVEQEYNLINDTAWLLKKQKFSYNSKFGKNTKNGITTVIYNSYELNKVFPKKHFGMELSTTTQEAYNKDTAYWNNVRSEPLTSKELKFIRYKDSVYNATNTKQYYDSVDAKTNKITFAKVLYEGITFYNRSKERRFNIGSIAQLYQPFQPGGVRIGYNFLYEKTFKNKKNINGVTNFSYGLRNKDILGNVEASRMYNPFNRGTYGLSVGREFASIFPDDNIVNSISKTNIFRNNHFKINHQIELLNGLYLRNELEFAIKESIANYKFYNWNNFSRDTLFNSYWDSVNVPKSFATYNSFYNNISLSYTPFQTYMRESLQKVILGSKYPTFTLLWRKGIPNILGGVTNYDYLEFKINQTLQLGTVGVSKYTILIGKFLNREKIELGDRKFMRGKDPFFFNSPERNFQHLDSTFELTKSFIEGHYVHEFNGAILNKIPLLKKLQFRELAGGGFLIAPERNLKYIEAFVGLETKPFRIFTEKFKLGIFAVGSVSNKFKNPIEIKVSIRNWDKINNRWQ